MTQQPTPNQKVEDWRTLKPGDRVRITVEAEWTEGGKTVLIGGPGDAYEFYARELDAATIELLPKPFKVGDRVRFKRDVLIRGCVIAVTKSGLPVVEGATGHAESYNPSDLELIHE